VRPCCAFRKFTPTITGLSGQFVWGCGPTNVRLIPRNLHPCFAVSVVAQRCEMTAVEIVGAIANQQISHLKVQMSSAVGSSNPVREGVHPLERMRRRAQPRSHVDLLECALIMPSCLPYSATSRTLSIAEHSSRHMHLLGAHCLREGCQKVLLLRYVLASGSVPCARMLWTLSRTSRTAPRPNVVSAQPWSALRLPQV
jgi:hypothetical protein